MPLTCVGDLLTINFDKTITKNLQLQKFAVPLHCQQKKVTVTLTSWHIFEILCRSFLQWQGVR